MFCVEPVEPCAFATLEVASRLTAGVQQGFCALEESGMFILVLAQVEYRIPCTLLKYGSHRQATENGFDRMKAMFGIVASRNNVLAQAIVQVRHPARTKALLFWS
jgi:hypothetical protein